MNQKTKVLRVWAKILYPFRYIRMYRTLYAYQHHYPSRRLARFTSRRMLHNYRKGKEPVDILGPMFVLVQSHIVQAAVPSEVIYHLFGISEPQYRSILSCHNYLKDPIYNSYLAYLQREHLA